LYVRSVTTALNIIGREQWSDERAPGARLAMPVRNVFLHCTVVPDVRLPDEEMAAVRRGDEGASWRSLAAGLGSIRSVDRAHKRKGWAGAGYNFAGFDDGTCWEVRGWTRSGAQAEGWNHRSLGYCWFIDGDRRRPTDEAWATAARWMLVGLEDGLIHPDFDLRGHRRVNTVGKSCPGKLITDGQIEDLERWVKAAFRKGIR
jgi:N-acetylmuramoyl-L-alanine amidase